MKAFVTGATGFIGGRLARRLVERGDSVTALARSPTPTSWVLWTSSTAETRHDGNEIPWGLVWIS